MVNWRTAIILTALILLVYGGFMMLNQYQREANLQQLALNQVEGDAEDYAALKAAIDDQGGLVATWLMAISILAVFLATLIHPKRKHFVMSLLVLPVLLAACKPYNQPEFIEIGPNETAFVVPQTGATGDQIQFQSVEFLQANQVATKRILITKEEVQTGHGWWEVKYIPSVRVIVVDRTPVTREWTSAVNTGTSSSNQAFGVESSESIDFRIGATCSARVDEQDAAAFLYYFSGKSLAAVMDENIRGFIQAELFREFGNLTLLDARVQKSEIFARVFEAAKAHFSPLGVTITSLGGSEGMIYSDPNIQTSINANFEAQQEQVRAAAAATAQAVDNGRLISQANAQATATVIAGQAEAEVIRLQGEAEAQVLASQGSQIQQYPGLVNYELALQSEGQVPQFLIVGDEGANNLPFGFFLDPAATPTPAPAGN